MPIHATPLQVVPARIRVSASWIQWHSRTAITWSTMDILLFARYGHVVGHRVRRRVWTLSLVCYGPPSRRYLARHRHRRVVSIAAKGQSGSFPCAREALCQRPRKVRSSRGESDTLALWSRDATCRPDTTKVRVVNRAKGRAGPLAAVTVKHATAFHRGLRAGCPCLAKKSVPITDVRRDAP
jgi:hypothetical protein